MRLVTRKKLVKDYKKYILDISPAVVLTEEGLVHLNTSFIYLIIYHNRGVL